MAPAFIAATAMGTSPWPVITTIGRLTPSSCSRRTRVRPSISGMRTSVTMQPSCSRGASSRNSRGEAKVCAFSPAVTHRKASDSLTASSSSTM